MAASSLRMTARHSWHRADRSLGGPAMSGGGRPACRAGCAHPAPAPPAYFSSRNWYSPWSSSTSCPLPSGPFRTRTRDRARRLTAAPRPQTRLPPPAASAYHCQGGGRSGRSLCKISARQRPGSVSLRPGDRTGRRPSFLGPQRTHPPPPRARSTHIPHCQPHGLDGLHVVDLAALTELRRQHALGEDRCLRSAGLHIPAQEGTQPTLLDTSQCTRGTTT